jgi:hypothetical protein
MPSKARFVMAPGLSMTPISHVTAGNANCATTASMSTGGALVWALTELMLTRRSGGEPRMRVV